MRKKDSKPKYHDEKATMAEDYQSGNGMVNNEDHNLFAAGSILGQRINTNSYDYKYTRKKGMRFFAIAVTALFIFAVVFMLVNPYDDITVLYSNDKGITMHKVDVNLFGRYYLKEESSFEYNYENLKYGRLDGKAAQLAVMANSLDADVIISDSGTLLELGLENHLIDHSHYTGNTRSELLLRHDLFENDIDLMYGLKADDVDFIVATDADAISITSGDRQRDFKVIKRFVGCLFEELDYTAERVG